VTPGDKFIVRIEANTGAEVDYHFGPYSKRTAESTMRKLNGKTLRGDQLLPPSHSARVVPLGPQRSIWIVARAIREATMKGVGA